MHTAILIISNPVSGDGKGVQFVQDHILPLIKDYNYELQETTRPGAAGELAADFLQRQKQNNDLVVLVISGGDGTFHEVINGIGLQSRPLQLVICPQGTANALYSTLFPLSHGQVSTVEYRLRSLNAFLGRRTTPLSLTKTRLLTSDNQVTVTILGVVVASTALHASILETAEHLRSTIPGIERFKVAAAGNLTKWYQSHVRLFSGSKTIAQIYDPISRTFRQLEATELDLLGPFAYFLSTVNVDRLEPTFEISPLFAKLPPTRGEMELIVIRPLRDPSLGHDSEENRSVFTHKLSAVLQGAYMQGSHINLRYRNGIPSAVGDGPFVVEYIRCGGWEWLPNEMDGSAHLVCVDGTVLEIPRGGKVTCEVICDSTDGFFSVCV